MHGRQWGKVVAMLALFTCAQHAPAAGIFKLKEYDTPSYRLILQDGMAAPVAVRKLAELEAVLRALLPYKPVASSMPTCIYVVPNDLWVNYMVPSSHGSQFVAARFANYLLIGGAKKAGALRPMTYAEYTHAFLRSRSPRRYPYWFEQGLSLFVSSAQMDSEHAIIGGNPFITQGTDINSWPFSWDLGVGHQHQFSSDHLFRLEPSHQDYRDDPYLAYHVDIELWAFVHRALVGDPEFGRRTFSFLDALELMIPIETAVPKAYDMSLDSLDRQMTTYQAKSRFKKSSVSYEAPAPVPMTGPRVLAPSEPLELLARAMIEGDLKPDNVPRLLDAAEQIEPESVGIQMLRLRLAARNENPAEFNRLLPAMEARASDAAVARELGLVLLERVQAADPQAPDVAAVAPLSEQAFELLGHSLQAHADDPEVAWGYALLAARLRRDLDGASTWLAAARAVQPRNPDLAAAAAQLAQARGETRSVMPDLVQVVKFSRQPEQRLWAAKQIDEIRGSK